VGLIYPKDLGARGEPKEVKVLIDEWEQKRGATKVTIGIENFFLKQTFANLPVIQAYVGCCKHTFGRG